jgi:hypothetical protein
MVGHKGKVDATADGERSWQIGPSVDLHQLVAIVPFIAFELDVGEALDPHRRNDRPTGSTTSGTGALTTAEGGPK